jgi:hypothetical protein
MRKKTFFYTIILALLIACSGGNLPKDVLSKKKLVPILVDIHLAEAINNQRFNLSITKDSLPEDLYLSICKKHKVERSVVEETLLYYGNNTSAFIPIYDEVLNILSEMEIKAKTDTIRPVNAGENKQDSTKNMTNSPSEPDPGSKNN